MKWPVSDHIVYNKDKGGSPYAVGEIVYEGKILQHAPLLGDVDTILKALPDFATRQDDIWILDYAKSGTHWMNEILNVLTRDAVTMPLKDKQERMFELICDIEHFQQMESPRLFNSHLPLKFIPTQILDKGKLLFLLRNPKSVAVSYYYHHLNLSAYQYDGTFAGFLPTFLEGIDDLYGTWFDTVTEYWKYFKNKHNVLFVVYEDLIKKPVEGIKEVSDFLGLNHDISFCEHVAKMAKFESMREREQALIKTNSAVRGKDGIIRKGSTTEWKSHFNVAQNEMFDAVYDQKMKDYPDLREKIKYS